MLKESGIKRAKESAISLAFKATFEDGTHNVTLASKNIGDSHINEIIRCLKHNSQAKGLDLGSNKITDDGIQNLCKGIAEHGQSLLKISFANNKISEKCLEPMAATLRLNKSLKTLNLSGNGFQNRVFKNKIKNVLTWVEITF